MTISVTDYVPTPSSGGKFAGQGILQESETAITPVGTRMILNDGRCFVYCQNGSSTALAAGKVVQQPAWDSATTALDATTASKGDSVLNITTASGVTADEYADGYVMVEDDTGEGQVLKIKTHPAASSTSGLFTLYDPLRVAFAAATTVALVRNPFTGVVILEESDQTETGVAVGVPLIRIQASYFFWAQYKGVCNVLIQGTPAIGTGIGRGTDDGSLAQADSTFTEIGTVIHTGVNGEYRPIMLDIL